MLLTESGNLFRRKTKTVVFLVNFIIQLATFAVNYVGEPFNVSIWKNRFLIWGLIACAVLSCVLIAGKRKREREGFFSLELTSAFALLLCVPGVFEDVSSTFEVVGLPLELKVAVAAGGLCTWLLSLVVETTARLAFPEKVHENLLL